jgi:glycosyltransferase involved in cell wall biosynthesis
MNTEMSTSANLETRQAPISVLIPTANRASMLKLVLTCLLSQKALPSQVVIIDASEDDFTQQACDEWRKSFSGQLHYERAKTRGAAAQRNQGITTATEPFILFMDDDIEFGADCVEKLWTLMKNDEEKVWGGVNAMITNQQYGSPGRLSRILFRLVSRQDLPSYAGRCIGPVLTLLPQDDPSLPEYVEVEWLNTTCTLYRREALPTPLFTTYFTGYSLGEDVNLSLIVGRNWKLANARTARIVHHSYAGHGKPKGIQLAKMSLMNRYYIMTQTLKRNFTRDYLNLFLVEGFEMVSLLRSPKTWRQFPAMLAGKTSGAFVILAQREHFAAKD